MLPIKVKYLTEDATEISMPREGDIGIDLFSNENVYIKKGETVLISTGACLELPPGYAFILKDRSSMSKTTHVLAGVIDNSYRGEIKIRMFCHAGEIKEGDYTCDVYIKNDSRYGVNIKKGQKIAQALIVPDLTQKFSLKEVEELSGSVRGDKGFGSTGR